MFLSLVGRGGFREAEDGAGVLYLCCYTKPFPSPIFYNNSPHLSLSGKGAFL